MEGGVEVGPFLPVMRHDAQRAVRLLFERHAPCLLYTSASFDGQLVALHDVGKEGHVLLFLLDRFIQDGPPARQGMRHGTETDPAAPPSHGIEMCIRDRVEMNPELENGMRVSTKGRVSLEEQADGSLRVVPHYWQERPDLDADVYKRQILHCHILSLFLASNLSHWIFY